MKKTYPTLLALIITLNASAAGIPVIDWTAILQAIRQVELALELVAKADLAIKRAGDPAAIIQIAGGALTTGQLSQQGVGKSLPKIQLGTTGQSGQAYDGNGIYESIEPSITIAGDQTITRPTADYRKHEALQETVVNYNQVMSNTQDRRDNLRAAQLQTTDQLKVATTDAEVQKLNGITASEHAELATISAERAEAAQRVLIQQMSNEADAARQAQAADELRTASVQSALTDALRFFKADTTPLTIPNPRTIAP